MACPLADGAIDPDTLKLSAEEEIVEIELETEFELETKLDMVPMLGSLACLRRVDVFIELRFRCSLGSVLDMVSRGTL